MHRPLHSSIEPLESRIAPAVFSVTNLNDTGAGSLRQALANADAHAGADAIAFHLPTPPLHGENTIVLASGLTSTGDVTITGPGSGKLIVDAAGTGRVLLITDGSSVSNSPATISGISFIDGNAAGAGGGIYTYESLTLKNVVVSSCQASAAGGGIAVAPDPGAHIKVSVANTTINRNTAAGSGGGIALYEIDSLKLANCIIIANASSAGPGGGGVYMDMGATGTGITIAGCTVTANKADHGAGILANSNATSPKASTTISSTIISGNVSTDTTAHGGGGLYIQAGTVGIAGSSITGNYSAYNGGGIDGQKCAVTISKSLISGNRSQSGGGGFNLYNLRSLSITGSSILSNLNATTAPGDGGGYAETTGTGAITITGSVISGNQADHGGGLFLNSAIADPTGKFMLSGDTFSGNLSSGSGAGGGGGLVIGRANAIVTGATITNNISAGYDGAGLLAIDFTSLSVSKSTISGNQTLQHGSSYANGGAGIYLGGGAAVPFATAAISNCTIRGNATASSGAGLSAIGGVSITVTNSIFSGNHANVDGAAINIVGGGLNSVNLSIAGSTFADNTCLGNSSEHGGALFAGSQGSVAISKSKFSSNSASTGGGAICMEDAATFKMTDTILIGNSSTFGGGLEMLSIPSVVITGGSITNNVATVTGGGIAASNTVASITGAVITGNTASAIGGGMYETGGAITLQISKVFANTAHTGPDVSGTFTFV